jgi:uncharacterized protein DUF3325
MKHLLPFMLCVAGFAALAFAMRRQQRDLFGRPLQPVATYVLRVAGAFALLLALGVLVAGQGWGLALVMFSGHTSISAGIVLCALIGYSRMSARKPGHRHAR